MIRLTPNLISNDIVVLTPKVDELGYNVDKLDNKIDNTVIVENPQFNNIINWNRINHKSLLWNPGPFAENIGYWNTDYVQVLPETEYICYNPVTNILRHPSRVLGFTNNKTSLGAIAASDGKFTTPTNCAYVVMNYRYIHNGGVGEYNDTLGWDDNINKLIVNVANNGIFVEPNQKYLSTDIAVVHNNTITNKVIYIDNGISGQATLTINRTKFSGEITIVVCGQNIFDGVIQSGYWNGDTISSSSTHSASINPMYVNGGDYITTNKACRVTEFCSDGTYNTSYLATARQPYKVSLNTDYIHIASETANMEAMCVYYGRSIPNTDVTFAKNEITHTVRTWGTTLYDIPLDINDGSNMIFVKMSNSPNITLTYNRDLSKSTQASAKNYTRIAANPIFVAHRGSVIDAPENTLYAIKQAFLNGFKSVEIDVRLTSDDVPVLLHDSTIDRTSNGTGSLNGFTIAQLETYDFGSWFSPKFANAKIPTLERALNLIRSLNMIPHIDIAGSNGTETLITSICDLLYKYGLAEKAIWLLNPSNSGNTYIRNFYTSKGIKYTAMYQVSTFPESSILNLFETINNSGRVYECVNNMGISVNISSVTSAIKTQALSYDKPIPIGVYFIDDFSQVASITNFPFEFITTNHADVPALIAQYYAPEI